MDFLQNTASSQISEVLNPNELSSEELQLLEKQPTQRGSKQDSPGRFSGISASTNWTKLLLGGGGGKKYHPKKGKVGTPKKKKRKKKSI